MTESLNQDTRFIGPVRKVMESRAGSIDAVVMQSGFGGLDGWSDTPCIGQVDAFAEMGRLREVTGVSSLGWIPCGMGRRRICLYAGDKARTYNRLIDLRKLLAPSTIGVLSNFYEQPFISIVQDLRRKPYHRSENGFSVGKYDLGRKNDVWAVKCGVGRKMAFPSENTVWVEKMTFGSLNAVWKHLSLTWEQMGVLLTILV
ncbi:hypothetical protein QJS10_CPB12g00753 [Acorus calamus]|uniref:Uncharacterized protein n=1 Tax=Acorus calamus TaxID=4465 RepID=A0AAV9DLU3_ACOCL|nr:hypothetical protein QJS10_CPB12g00753 [Acorus calamus]